MLRDMDSINDLGLKPTAAASSGGIDNVGGPHNYAQALQNKKLLQLLRRKKQLEKENGILFYLPHAKQELFHSAGEMKFRYMRTGNRFGKSEMGAAEDVAFALGERTWLEKGDPKRYLGIPKHSTKGLIIVADWDKAEEIFTCTDDGAGKGKLFKFLPRASVLGTERNHSGVICKIRVACVWGGESTIHLDTIKSYMSNEMGQESSFWDWIHVDEPCPREMWIANARGLTDRDGKAWFTCTPISEPWINDFFIESRFYKQEFTRPYVTGDRWVMSGSMRDNPYLTEEAITAYEAMLTDDEKQCRINGLPLALIGMVYKEFDRDVHILTEDRMKQFLESGWTTPTRPPESFTIRYAIDPHPRTPHAVLFAATAPNGRVFFYHEIFEQCLISQLAEQINEVVDGYFVHTAICDPSAFIENPVDGTTWVDELEQYGIYVEKGPKDLAGGIIQVKQALKTNLSFGTFLNFSGYLRETLKEIERYCWDPKKINRPIDKDDHMMENLYRLVLIGLEYVPRRGKAVFVPQESGKKVDLSLPSYFEPVVKKLPRYAR